MAVRSKSEGEDWLWVACKFKPIAWRCEGQEVGKAFFNWSPSEPSIRDGTTVNYNYCAFVATSSHYWNDVPCTDEPRAMCVLRSPVQIQHQSLSGRQHLNWCLVDHVIREIVNVSALRCASDCLKKPQCRSFNIKGTNGEQKVCQLNDASRSDDPDKFQEINAPCQYYSS